MVLVFSGSIEDSIFIVNVQGVPRTPPPPVRL